MERLTIAQPGGLYNIRPGYTWQAVAQRLAAYEDFMERFKMRSIEDAERIFRRVNDLGGTDLMAQYKNLGTIDRLRELARADREGLVVLLPFPLHSTLFDASNEAQPELLKDFRLSATWTHCGLVFQSPWSIFLNNIEHGYIKQMSEEAEAALKGENHEADPV